jgi:hypothetical protein
MIFSLAAWILLGAYTVQGSFAMSEPRCASYACSIADASPSSAVLWSLLLVAALPCWSVGLLMRRHAWNQLGREETAHSLVVGPLVMLFLPILLGPLVGYFASYFGTPLIVSAAWGYYTFLESRAMKWLTDDCDIDLRYSRICSLAGIVAWAVACVGTHVVPSVGVLQRGYPFSYSWSLFPLFPVWAFLVVAPFLMASCMFVIRAIGRRKS